MSQRVPYPPASEDHLIGWAVVGLGKLATEHILPAFADCRRSRLASLVSGSSTKMRQLGERYRVRSEHLYDYAALERLRDDPTVDAVYLALPSGLHAEYAIRAARAGKHVVCEAPMAASVEDATAMVNVCRTVGRLLMVVDRARFSPHHQSAVAALRAGELGTLKTIVSSHARRLDPSTPADRWRGRLELAGGGSLMAVGIQGLRAARDLAGEEPVEVFAMVPGPGESPFGEVEESCSFLLRFPGGVLATGTASLGSERHQSIQAHGSHGRLELGPTTDEGSPSLHINRGVERLDRTVSAGNPFALAIDHMAQCIREQQPPCTTGEEGLRDMHLLEALYESARTREPVRLDPATGIKVSNLPLVRPSTAPPGIRASVAPPRPPSAPGRPGAGSV